MCMMDKTVQLDMKQSDAFVERLVGTLNEAATAMMISIGHRTRLFDTLAKLPASNSQEIADAAGLNERYVREWLNAMVTARVVNYDAAAGTYVLPEEHAAALTRAAAPANLAATMQFIAVLGSVEDRIVECFEKGGGVPYEEFKHFQRVMAEESDQSVVSALHEHILPLAPGVTRRLEAGIEVADIGCGSGHAVIEMALKYPKSRFVGYEISEEGLAEGRRRARELGLQNARFAYQDVAELDEPGRFDLITGFDVIHDQARPAEVLRAVRRCLRDDGIFLMQDMKGSSQVEKNMEHPVAPFLYTVSCMHCMTVSLAENGAGLGTMWGRETAERMLGEAGFENVGVHELEHDMQNYFYVAYPRVAAEVAA